MSSTLAAVRPCSTNTASAARSSSILARRSAGRGITDSAVTYREAGRSVKGIGGASRAALPGLAVGGAPPRFTGMDPKEALSEAYDRSAPAYDETAGGIYVR